MNGYHVGGRPSGYAEFSFDLTEILSYANDDDLVVSVRVEHTDISDSRWYNGSGITRRVELEVHEQVRVARARHRVHDADGRRLGSRRSGSPQALVNDTADAVTVRVHHELRSLTSGRVHAFDDRRRGARRAHPPTPWSRQRCRSRSCGPTPARTSIASRRPSPGCRTARSAAPCTRRRSASAPSGSTPTTASSINGEPRTLKGVCLHEDAGCLGTAVPTEVWLRRLLKLKEMGCNAVRMAHNPHAPELYRLCDVLGFYVIDEAFDEWENAKNKWWQGHNVYPPRHQGYAKDFHEWHERDLGAMIDAHRNHPSIIAWSIGNEIDYPNDPVCERAVRGDDRQQRREQVRKAARLRPEPARREAPADDREPARRHRQGRRTRRAP